MMWNKSAKQTHEEGEGRSRRVTHLIEKKNKTNNLREGESGGRAPL